VRIVDPSHAAWLLGGWLGGWLGGLGCASSGPSLEEQWTMPPRRPLPRQVAEVVAGTGDLPETGRLRVDGFWEADETLATTRARERGRGLLIDFYADWCDPCLTMDRDVFSDPEVRAKVTAGYVPFRIDVTEFTRTNREQLERYEVDQLPAVLIFGPDGRLRARVDEAISVDRMLAVLASGAPAEAAPPK